MLQIVAGVKIRVRQNCLACHLVERQILRAEFECRGDHYAVFDTLGIFQRPAHRLHAAETATHHRCPAVYTQTIRQARLASYPVPGAHCRKITTPGYARGGVDTARPGGAVTAPEIVQADDKKTFGIDRFAWPDAFVPPAGLPVLHAVKARGMMVAAERVTYQHGVGSVGIESAVGLVDQFVTGELPPAGQAERLLKPGDLR